MNSGEKRSRAVIITGATKGLGKELSLAFAAANYKIIGIYRSDHKAAQAFECEFRAKNFDGVFIKQDITIAGSWTQFDQAVADCENNQLTFIANASPPFVPKPLHLIEWQEIAAQMDVNVKGAFLVFKRLLPLMIKGGGGTLISVLSSALAAPPKGFASYVASKFAAEGLNKAIAAEYHSRGIRAFSVAPGFMETAMTKDWSEHLKALIYAHGGASQQPAEIAAEILSLAENPDSTGNGETYLLNGNRRST